MMKNLRSYKILDYLKQKKYCSVQELMEHFQVSSATIHRDLAALAARNAVRKMHGGAAYPDHAAAFPERPAPFTERVTLHQAQKQALAQRAMERIGDGDILFLDSSTTVGCLAALLERSNFANLTIITNSAAIIGRFAKFPAHYVLIGIGGSFDPQLNAFLGQAALRELDALTISKAFVSAFAVDDDKVMTNHEHHAGLLMKVMDLAGQKFLLADHSKFNRGGLFKFAVRRAFDEILS